MIRATAFENKRVAVFGLGGSGVACVRALQAGGADVVGWDDGEGSRERAREAGVMLLDLNVADFAQFSSLVLAPGVPLTHPEPHWTVVRAKAAGVEIIGDVEIFMRERVLRCPQVPVIGITGTNGKSTTTALTAHLLAVLGHDVQMGGNIGKAVLTLEDLAPERIYVVELSSYQIDLTPTLNATVGVFLNVTPDHLDRHGTIGNYAAIKERLARESDVAAVCIDDAFTRAAAERLEAGGGLFAFTAGKGAAIVPQLYAIGSSIFVHERHESHASSEQIADLAGVRSLRGSHNVQNALAALTAIRALQGWMDKRKTETFGRIWRPEKLAGGLMSFPGLAHRLEEIGHVGKVTFINDSKATNAEAAEKALAAFDGGVYWILGGLAKSGGITALEPYFPRVAGAYLIGAAAEEFAKALDGRVAYRMSQTIDAAIEQAARDAAMSDHDAPVVLLSPACASFDQFRNFEVRGDHFRDAVSRLPGFGVHSPGDGSAGT